MKLCAMSTALNLANSVLILDEILTVELSECLVKFIDLTWISKLRDVPQFWIVYCSSLELGIITLHNTEEFYCWSYVFSGLVSQCTIKSLRDLNTFFPFL